MNNLFLFLFLLSIVGLVVGLVKPSYTKLKSRKEVSFLFGGAIIVFFILVGVTGQSTSINTPPSNVPAPQVVSNTTSPSAPTTTPNTLTPPVPIKTTSAGNKNGETVNQTTPTPVSQPTPPPQTDNQNTSPASNETVSQANAVAKAIDYLNYTAFSYEGLIAQLEYDQFSQADATYGADNSGADWNAEAAAKAKDYMSYSAFSRGSLIAQLEYDKFTQAQAEYGANSVGLTQ
jgi:hypothetical protein